MKQHIEKSQALRLDILCQLLIDLKDWDIENKIKQGQFLMSHRLRRRIQQALGEAEG